MSLQYVDVLSNLSGIHLYLNKTSWMRQSALIGQHAFLQIICSIMCRVKRHFSVISFGSIFVTILPIWKRNVSSLLIWMLKVTDLNMRLIHFPHYVWIDYSKFLDEILFSFFVHPNHFSLLITACSTNWICHTRISAYLVKWKDW